MIRNGHRPTAAPVLRHGLRGGALLAVVAGAPLWAQGAPPPAWVIYPKKAWTWALPADAGFDPVAWSNYLTGLDVGPGSCGGDIHTGGRWGTCVQRGGYLIHCWGDEDYLYQSASLGKAFNGFALQLAIDQGYEVDGRPIGEVPIDEVWPDVPGPDCGDRATLDNLFAMRGNYATSNGFQDGCTMKCGSGYSTGGQWRLNQALTYVLQEDLKSFLDRELFGPMGIDPSDWYWLTGRQVNENRPPPNAHPDQMSLYPQWTDSDRWYGCFIDPPYEIDGHPVHGGGGWVGMSPKDLARIGLLLASDGHWDGRKLIEKTWRVSGHAGCGSSDLGFRSSDLVAWGRVSTRGWEKPPSASGPVQRPTTEAPVFSPAAGNYEEAVTVDVSSAAPDGKIRFTTDGSEPDATSPLWQGPLRLAETTVLRAIATSRFAEPSAAVEARYEIASKAPPDAGTGEDGGPMEDLGGDLNAEDAGPTEPDAGPPDAGPADRSDASDAGQPSRPPPSTPLTGGCRMGAASGSISILAVAFGLLRTIGRRRAGPRPD